MKKLKPKQYFHLALFKIVIQIIKLNSISSLVSDKILKTINV